MSRSAPAALFLSGLEPHPPRLSRCAFEPNPDLFGPTHPPTGLSCSFGLNCHPSGLSRHPLGLSRHPFGPSRHPFGLNRHPFGPSRHPFGLNRHPFGLSRPVNPHPFGLSRPVNPHPFGLNFPPVRAEPVEAQGSHMISGKQ